MAMFGGNARSIIDAGNASIAQARAQAAATRPAFFAQGGVGRNIAGAIGDGLAQMAGFQPVFGPAQRVQRESEARLHQLMELERFKAEQDAARLQGVNLGGGGFGTWSQAGGFNILREPTPEEPDVPTLQRNFQWLKSLPEEDQRLAATMLPGYALTPAGVATTTERAAAVAEAAAKAKAAYRAPPAPKPAPKPPAGFVLD